MPRRKSEKRAGCGLAAMYCPDKERSRCSRTGRAQAWWPFSLKSTAWVGGSKLAGVVELPEASSFNGCDSAAAVEDPSKYAGNPAECRTFDQAHATCPVKNGHDLGRGHWATRDVLLNRGYFTGCHYAQVTGPPLCLQMRSPAI